MTKSKFSEVDSTSAGMRLNARRRYACTGLHSRRPGKAKPSPGNPDSTQQRDASLRSQPARGGELVGKVARQLKE